MLDQELIAKVLDGRYKILSIIGQGGMGTVYLAEETELNRNVAVKVMHSCHLTDADSLARFEREGKVLSSLRHRHIRMIYRLGLADKQVPYLAMEYLEGRSLRAVLNEENKLSASRCLHIALQICDALDYAHEAGVVHRDIKPNNILLLDSPEKDFVKIVDFGLVRLMPDFGQSTQKLTQTGLLIGTVQYLSPEQCLAQSADRRSDIYALACLIYECLTGQLPLEADNPIGLMHRHAHEMPLSLTSLVKGQNLPQGLDRVLLKALQKDPQLRYQNMSELRADLCLVQSGQGQLIETQVKELNLRPWASLKASAYSKRLFAFTLLPFMLAALGFFFLVQYKQLSMPVAQFKPDKAAGLARGLTRAEDLVADMERRVQKKEMAGAAISASRAVLMLSAIPARVGNPAVKAREIAILKRLQNVIVNLPLKTYILQSQELDNLYWRYEKTDLFEGAVILRELQLQAAKNKGDWHSVIATHNYLTSRFISYKQYDLAKKELDLAEKEIKAHGFKFSIVAANALLCKQQLFLALNQKQYAAQCLHNALATLSLLPDTDKYGIMAALFDVGQSALKTKEFACAEDAFLRCQKISLSAPVAEHPSKNDIAIALADLYLAKKDYKKAEQYIEQVRADNPYHGTAAMDFDLKMQIRLAKILKNSGKNKESERILFELRRKYGNKPEFAKSLSD